MKIAIIGTGYVGTVAGACFAEAGNQVVCVDKDPRKVLALSGGDPVIFEPQLEDLLKKNLAEKRIEFTTSIKDAVNHAEILFMTVGTPSLDNGEADLSYLEMAAREVARAMTHRKILVNKSTVPVGTQRKVAEWMRSETETPFDVVSNPEFLREGAAVHDFLHPERVVIGTHKTQVFDQMRQLYEPFAKDRNLILHMDPISAELTKYACNAMLATRISFMNELAHLCEKTGGDVECIRQGMGLDSRIGKHFLNAGIGYGGSCFPKDIRALLATAKATNVPLRIVRAVEEVNELQKKHLLEVIWDRLGRRLHGKTLTLWGLAFKPETDDIREAPSLVLIRNLLQAGAKIRAYDPVAAANTQTVFGSNVYFCDDPYSALKGSDGLIIATEWDEFRKADYTRVKTALRRPFIFDGRNILDPEKMLQAGFFYHAVGRGQTRDSFELLARMPLESKNADGNGAGLESQTLTA